MTNPAATANSILLAAAALALATGAMLYAIAPHVAALLWLVRIMLIRLPHSNAENY
jgi:hypothetical protein